MHKDVNSKYLTEKISIKGYSWKNGNVIELLKSLEVTKISHDKLTSPLYGCTDLLQVNNDRQFQACLSGPGGVRGHCRFAQSCVLAEFKQDPKKALDYICIIEQK